MSDTHATNLAADETASATGVAADAPDTDADQDAALEEATYEVDTSEDGDVDDEEEAKPATDELVDVEFDGAKHRIPKALQSAFLMQQDYTRKTQAVAEAARQVEEARQAFESQREAQIEALQAEIDQRAQVQTLRSQLQQWEDVRWDILEQEDRENGTNEVAHNLLRHSQLKDALVKAEAELNEHQAQREYEEQTEKQRRQALEAQEDTQLVRHGYQYLTEKIPDWPQVASKVASFGAERFGFTPAEIAEVRDPRYFEVLHLAYLGAQKVSQAQNAQRLARAQQTQPAATVPSGRSGPPNREPPSTAAWMEWRAKQVAAAAQKGRGRR